MRLRDVIWPLVIFAILMVAAAKLLTWGLDRWDWSFWWLWMIAFLAIGFVIEYFDRKRRRLNALRRAVHPERNLPDLPE
jgi:fatty acid desaturase